MNYSLFHNLNGGSIDLLKQTESIDPLVIRALVFVLYQVLGSIANSLTITISTAGGLQEFWFHNILSKFLSTYGLSAVQMVIHDSRHKHVFVPGRRYNNLIFVDSFESLRETHILEHNRNYDSLEYYFIFLQIADRLMPPQREKILKYCFDNYWLHCSVMIQNAKGEVLIYTYFPFQEEGCFRTDPVLINRFEDDHFVHKEMFPNKLKNFHRCPLKLTTWHVPPFVKMKPNQTIDQISGMEISILKALSKEMNFTLELDTESNVNTPVEALKVLADRRTNISVGYFRSTADRNMVATSSYFTYHTPVLALMFKRMIPFDSLDILTYPFDIYTWIVLIVSCVVLTLVNTLELQSERSSNRWHVLEALLGVPTVRVPKKLSLKANFIVWMLTTFLLRCSYQSLLFYLYRINFYKPPLLLISDLVENNYKAICTQTSEPFMQYVSHNVLRDTLPMTVFNTSNEIEILHYVVAHKDKNIVALTTEEFIIYFAANEMAQRTPLATPDEYYTSQQLSFYFPKHTYIKERFNEYILRLHQSRILDKFRTEALIPKHIHKAAITTVYEDELMINMHQVSGFLKVIITLYAVAIGVFILELVSQWVTILQKVL